MNGKSAYEKIIKYDNKTFYYVTNKGQVGFEAFVIEIHGKNNTFFYINYFLVSYEELLENDENSTYIFL